MLSTLFSYGFRPFFMAVGVYAPLILVVWIAYIALGWDMPLPMEAALWHAHEMIYGLVVAALAGFILTAMTNWTGAAPLRGLPLAGLFGLWIAGRLAMCLFDGLPFTLVAVVELSFLPVLGLYVARVLIKAGNRRNMVFLAIIGLLWAVDGLFLAKMAGFEFVDGLDAGRLALDLILIMLALVAGRIVPAFTRNWLMRQGKAVDIPVMAPLDKAAVLSLVLVLAVDLFFPLGWPAVAITAVAAVLHSLRLARWHGHKSLSDSLVWVLHLGYGLLVLGLWLKNLSLWGPYIPETAWTHAVGIGAAAVMILAVMSRAGLGHTGRPLTAPCGMGLAYLLISVSALARVAADLGLPGGYQLWLMVAAIGWIAGFAIFLVRYIPILMRPSLS